MAVLNRKEQPAFQELENVEIIEAEKRKLDNGIPLYLINAGTQDTVKIELVFRAGLWYQHRPLIASTANNLITEGTDLYSSGQIAAKFDHYGAFIQPDIEKDIASLSLYTLNKHIDKTLPLLDHVMKHPVFPQNEFNVMVKNAKQKFVVNNQRVSIIARKLFNKNVFGHDHPYGRPLMLEHFGELTRENAIDFYQRYYSLNNCCIIVSGKIRKELPGLLNDYFGKGKSNWQTPEENIATVQPGKRIEFAEKTEAVQSAIRIGRRLFTKDHPDYLGMRVLNTIIGGYFGSRLMSNIREDKGYTYGISSGVVSFHNEGYFFISTEVGSEVTVKARDEIYYEIKRLRHDLVPDEELQVVKNYLMGEFLRGSDGPFALAERLKGIIFYGLGYDFYHRYIETVKSISAEEIRELAQKYLQKEDLKEVIAGKK